MSGDILFCGGECGTSVIGNGYFNKSSAVRMKLFMSMQQGATAKPLGGALA